MATASISRLPVLSRTADAPLEAPGRSIQRLVFGNVRLPVVSDTIAHNRNGKAYYRHEGETLRSLPSVPPDREALDWHKRNVFVG